MMAFLRRVSHRRTLAVVASLVLLIGASLGLAIAAEARHDAQVRQAVSVQAHILADSVSAALAFNDLPAIQQYTAALRANPDIVAVGVYDDKGRIVATYGPEADPMRETGLTGPFIARRVPVVENGVKLGTVYFRQRTDTLMIRMMRYGGAGLLVVMATLMLGVMALDARALGRSNRRLRQEIEERERAEAALRQSQKMEAVGRLTGGIAHDFNNMLAVILGNLELLLRRYPEADPKLLRFVSSSLDAGKRAATLTQRLLAFSRRQPLDPKPVDVGRSVADLSELLARTLGEGIAIETVRTAGLWRAHVDAGQLETAIVNLAVNARDAMPGGGKLTIETANAYLDRSYAQVQDEVTPGQYVMVAVSDTGTGMAPEVLEKVFEPFFTTKSEGKGTGLGLSQVYGFVKQSKGHVKIYSEREHGTTVKIYLPRFVSDGSADDTQGEAPIPEAASGETILVIEDDADVRAYSVETLKELGYRVLEAFDGQSALAILREQRVDLVFTDVVLPGGMTGADIVAQAKAIQPGIKALFTTGYARNAIVHQGRLDKGVHLLTKPFSYADLAAKVRDILDMT